VAVNETAAAVEAASCPIAIGSHRTINIWWQGESDASDETQANAYEGRLGDYIDATEGQAWCVDPHWFILRLNTANARTYTSTVRTAQAAVCSARDNCHLIDLDGYPMADADHYSAPTYLEIGILLANQIMELGL
jgi:hypothetical protein